MNESPTYSLIVPVFRNAGSIGELMVETRELSGAVDDDIEVIFVIDGSPDDSESLLQLQIETLPCRTLIVRHSRNFGSFAAIRTGLGLAMGKVVAVRSADLQEPTTLIVDLLKAVDAGRHEVALGVRKGRADEFQRRLTARSYWWLYRKYVQSEMPQGGVDVFACSRRVRDELMNLKEANSSLVGLLIWLGFPFTVVPYERLRRRHGKSAWTLAKLMDYMSDSAFAFSRAPIKFIRRLGILGTAAGLLGGLVLLVLRLVGGISEAGYTPIMLAVLVMGSLNLAAIGVIGSYVWRAFENTKVRPHAVVESIEEHTP